MKHIWSVLCRSSQIDIDTQNLSLFNVFEQIVVNITHLPDKVKSEVINIPIEYEIVSYWVKEEKESKVKAEIRLEVYDPEGKLLKSFTQVGEMPETMTRLRSRIKILGLGITASGIYRFIVKIKEEGKSDFRIVSEIPLDVRLNKEISQKR